MLKARVRKEHSTVVNVHQITEQRHLEQNLQEMQEEIETYQY